MKRNMRRLFSVCKNKSLAGQRKIKNTEIEFRLDSQLIARQLNGQYKIEEERLFPLFIKIWNLKMGFGPIKFSEIPREQNKEADRLANEAMDGGNEKRKMKSEKLF